MRSLLLDVRSWDDLSGQVEPLAEVVKTLRSESVVVVLPRELSLDIAAGCERLAGLDDVEVLGVNVVVLGKVVVLLCDEHTLTEEVLVDLLSVGLGNKPGYYQYASCDCDTSHCMLTSWRFLEVVEKEFVIRELLRVSTKIKDVREHRPCWF